mmetsp:Transcript_28885/g.49617  ORF Transcript_28885/g.49617 Transcript_28885/m.49617 type:complete len:244 (-) Transcript_28885:376-1107(-)
MKSPCQHPFPVYQKIKYKQICSKPSLLQYIWNRLSYQHIVNQSNIANPNGSRDYSSSTGCVCTIRRQFRHIPMRSYGDVFNLRNQWLLAKNGVHRCNDVFTFGRKSIVFGLITIQLCGGKSFVEYIAGGAFDRMEICIARAHCQTIRFSYCGAHGHDDGHVQITHHALNQNALRDILLPKECIRGLNDVEELADYRGDASKEIRSCQTFADVAEIGRLHVAQTAARVHVRLSGSKHTIHTQGA